MRDVSLAKSDGEPRKTPLETRKFPKQGRRDVTEHVMRISAVRNVERINPQPDFSRLPVLTERQVEVEIAVDFHVQGKIDGETQGIRHAYVILQDVHVRVGKS